MRHQTPTSLDFYSGVGVSCNEATQNYEFLFTKKTIRTAFYIYILTGKTWVYSFFSESGGGSKGTGNTENKKYQLMGDGQPGKRCSRSVLSLYLATLERGGAVLGCSMYLY